MKAAGPAGGLSVRVALLPLFNHVRLNMLYYNAFSNPKKTPFRIDNIVNGEFLCDACGTRVKEIREHTCLEFEAWDLIHNSEYYKKLQNVTPKYSENEIHE